MPDTTFTSAGTSYKMTVNPGRKVFHQPVCSFLSGVDVRVASQIRPVAAPPPCLTCLIGEPRHHEFRAIRSSSTRFDTTQSRQCDFLKSLEGGEVVFNTASIG
jgi:hypothetical protein